MGARYFNSKTYPAKMEAVSELFESAQFCGILNIDLKDSNPNGEGVVYNFSHGFSGYSVAEDITVTLTSLQSDLTKVDIQSECTLRIQVVDWGRNERNVNAIFNLLDKKLSPKKSSSETEPVAEEKPDENKCASCGADIIPGSAFCPKCGAKVEAESSPAPSCTSCGAPIPADSAFCPKCGAKQ